MRLFFFWLVILIVFSASLHAQNAERLRKAVAQLPRTAQDTTRVRTLNTISWDTAYTNLDAAIGYGEQSLQLAEQLDDKVGVVVACNTLGTIYSDKGMFAKALEYHLKGLQIAEQNNLKIYIGSAYVNLSTVYNGLGEDQKSLDALKKAVRIMEETGNRKGACAAWCNLATSYYMVDSLQQALTAFKKGLQFAEELKQTSYKAHALSGLGQVHAELGHFETADSLLNLAYRLASQENDEYELAKITSAFSIVKREQQQFDSASFFAKMSLDIALRLGLRDEQRNSYMEMAELYKQWGKYDSAVLFKRRYLQLKDSLINETVVQDQQNLEQKYENEKRLAQIRLLQEEQGLQRWYIIGLIAGLLFLILFIIMLYKRHQFRVKVNQQLAYQNAIIEEKNRNITDSINYAARIQSAVSPDIYVLREYAVDAFILLLPRDIVSGDFWWATEHQNRLIFCAADCTGHGVPGGLMSVLGSSLLSEIVIEKNITQANLILEALRDDIITALKQSADSNALTVKDGMDIALCVLDRTTLMLQFSCAYNPVWIVRDGTLISFPVDKFPVGIHHSENQPFTLHQFQLQQGDMLYLHSDGFPDQFGGPTEKKFKSKQLQQLLVEASTLTCEVQVVKLSEALNNWRGNLEQVDDVLIVGVKI
jgi:serine phosphatase RsbU (regulator of sigma subunit)/tetratricopeptide (TPR) repeat protein